jgi:hypothetical protein
LDFGRCARADELEYDGERRVIQGENGDFALLVLLDVEFLELGLERRKLVTFERRFKPED